MFKIRASRNIGKSFYHQHLSANDYYSEGESISGVWHGSLANDFDLEGQSVDSNSFSLFQQNLNPKTGEKLTQRTREGGVRFYDFQCSAQKSVSIMSLFDERLKDAHQNAVTYAMQELERFAAVRVRKGANFKTKNIANSGNFLYAQFHHDSSRSLDPQLHTHNVVVNVTYDQENNCFKALETLDICKAINYFGKIYHNEMAKCCRNLGYNLRTTYGRKGQVKAYEIDLISDEQMQRFSKRRAQIDLGIEAFKLEFGRHPTPKEVAVITRQSRNAKLTKITSSQVKDLQLSQFDAAERAYLEHRAKLAQEKGFQSVQITEEKINEQLANAANSLFERSSVVTADKLLAEALNLNQGFSDSERLKKALESSLKIKCLDGASHNLFYSSLENIKKEKAILSFVEVYRNIYSKTSELDFTPFAGENEFDYTNQSKVIADILKCKDRFMLFRGVAGAGKTSTLKELCKGIQAIDKSSSIELIAPTNAAVSVLKEEGFNHSNTVAKFLQQPNGEHKNRYLIVDEAGLSSVNQGYELMLKAVQSESKVLFVGDAKQHKSVEAGEFFRLLEEHSSIFKTELSTIFRQQVQEYRQGIEECASGLYDVAFDRFDAQNWIHEGQGSYLDQAAEKFIEYLQENTNSNDFEFDPFDTIVVSPTHRECEELTAKIRLKLQKLDIISPSPRSIDSFSSYNWTKSQLKDLKNYQANQAICFIRNVPHFGKAGETALVSSADKKYIYLSNGKTFPLKKACDFIEVGEIKSLAIGDGDLLRFNVNAKFSGIINGAIGRVCNNATELEVFSPEGKIQKRIPLRENFKALSYGWVSTSHKSQGRTAKKVVVAAEKMNKDAFYVSLSRGKYSVSLHVPDKAHFRQLLARRSSDISLASDALELKKSFSKPNRSYLKSQSPSPNRENLTNQDINLHR